MKKDSQEQETVVKEKGKDTKWADGREEVWRRGWGKSAALAEGARLYSGGIHFEGVGGEGHNVTNGDTAGGGSKNESCQEF